MNRNNNGKLFGFISTFFIVIIFFCGCSEKNGLNELAIQNEFLGTWFCNMEFTLFSFRENNSNDTSANITELEFSKDTLYMTITTDNGTITMSNSYTVEGNQLILSLKSNGVLPDNMQPPFDRESPPLNGEQPQDWKPPFGGEKPINESQPSRTRLYTYRFEANNTILYLDEFPFLRLK